MLFPSWLRNRKCPSPSVGRHAQSFPPRSAGCRPRVEGLEDRTLLSTYTAGSVSALIADINAANMAGGSNTIILAPRITFDLKTANNTVNGANGLPVIGGTKAGNLTIVGNGDTVERIGGLTYNKRGTPSNPFRLFDVAPGASLTLQDVKLKGGWAYGSVGGAVYNQGTLTLNNCTVSTMTGGGIYNGGGTVTITSSTLTNISGGGIYAAGGTVTVSGSTLSGNSASYGGGIYAAGGTVTVSGTTLSGNSASFGGGIYAAGGTVTVRDSTLSGNSATYGGGIYNVATVTVGNSLLSGNSARFGGGIDNYGGTVTVSDNSTLSGNTAIHADYPWSLGDGGGIYNWGGTVTVSGSTLSGNTADALMGHGGGIFNRDGGTVTVKNSSRVTGNTASDGVDVYNLAALYLDATSTIGNLVGVSAIRI